MTEKEIRKSIVNVFIGWLGLNEADGSHMKIVNIYNNHKPLARGYKVKKTDAWCAAAGSAAAIVAGLTDIIPTECGCGEQIKLWQKIGRWQEADDYIPDTGDYIYYDWNDSGKGDNTGWSDHVGMVVEVNGNTIKVIEGNKNDRVEYRYIEVNARYIRGYGLPDYASKATEETVIENDADPRYNPVVYNWQVAAIADGFSFPRCGADGEWGSECESVAKMAIVKQRSSYKYPNLTKIVQKAVGVTVDGMCGKNTRAGIIAFQKAHGLTPDGCVGINTWKSILEV